MFPMMLTMTIIPSNAAFGGGLPNIAIAPTMVTPTELTAEPMTAIELVAEVDLGVLMAGG